MVCQTSGLLSLIFLALHMRKDLFLTNSMIYAVLTFNSQSMGQPSHTCSGVQGSDTSPSC